MSQRPGITNRVERSKADGRYSDVREVALTLFAERGYRYTSMRDIAGELGIQAPSLYSHVRSKQEILRDIMLTTMDRALADFRTAVGESGDVAEQLRRAAESHVRQTMRHRREVLVSNTELQSLNEENRAVIMGKRDEYGRGFRELIERGCSLGRFNVESPSLASYAILDMGNGVGTWYLEGGPLSEADITRQYGEFALQLVGAAVPSRTG
jgi:AcrR family transcriptional regulator